MKSILRRNLTQLDKIKGYRINYNTSQRIINCDTNLRVSESQSHDHQYK